MLKAEALDLENHKLLILGTQALDLLAMLFRLFWCCEVLFLAWGVVPCVRVSPAFEGERGFFIPRILQAPVSSFTER